MTDSEFGQSIGSQLVHRMHRTTVPQPIQSLIAHIMQRGFDVWLIGSRANPTSNPPNDWDFIVFGTVALVVELRSTMAIPDLDLLVVVDGDNFECPWPSAPDNVTKRGSLTKWKWKQIGDNAATYEGTKLPDDWGSVRKGTRVVA